MEPDGSERIWFLLQREPERRSPAMDAEIRTPHRSALLRATPRDPDVQWIRGPGGGSLQRDGPEEGFLSVEGKMADSVAEDQLASFLARFTPEVAALAKSI